MRKKRRLEKERLENERLENERLENERLENERLEKIRLEKGIKINKKINICNDVFGGISGIWLKNSETPNFIYLQPNKFSCFFTEVYSNFLYKQEITFNIGGFNLTKEEYDLLTSPVNIIIENDGLYFLETKEKFNIKNWVSESGKNYSDFIGYKITLASESKKPINIIKITK